jgi:ParB family transcriptional regulator, chromosome partitioning protein
MDLQKRVLIVEPDRGFALSLAALFQEIGCASRTAASAGEAELEIATRRPGLCVVRAELPDLSGFSLCARLRHDPVTAHLAVILYSSDTPPESLAEHARTPWAANGYLAMPLDTAALKVLAERILTAPEPVESADDAVMIDEAELVLEETEPSTAEAAPAPPAVPAGPVPPQLPRRPERSVLTEEDRLFAGRTFHSIAEHREALAAEAHRRRPPLRRELLQTPEGRAEALREDLRWREAQLARLSEIWEVRERELGQFDQRMHEKDVELAGLKGQVDDLLHRLASARDLFLQKEREYGASVDGLLLEKFSQEKELIEVVASNERRIHQLEREVRRRDDDLAQRRIALDQAQSEIERLDRQLRELAQSAAVREAELLAQLARGVEASATAQAEAAARQRELEGALVRAGEERERLEAGAREAAAIFQQRIDEREAAIHDREGRLGSLEEEHRRTREAARAREEDLTRENQDHLQQIAGLEGELEALSREMDDAEQAAQAELERLEAARVAEGEALERRTAEALAAAGARAAEAERSRLETEEVLELARQEARRMAEAAASAQQVADGAREEERTQAQVRLAAVARELEASSAQAQAALRSALERAEAERDESRLAADRREAELAAATARAHELELLLGRAEEAANEREARAAEAAQGPLREELARRDAARLQEVQRLQATLQDLARRERALQAELARVRPAGAGGGGPGGTARGEEG